MKRVGINCGHTVAGPGYGAVGLIRESEHTRLVGRALMEKLKAAGMQVTDCTVDEAATQQEYLSATVELANRQELDWFLSIHFNASASHTGRGAEVYTYGGRQYPEAAEICAGLASLGFRNRGVKDGSGLYVIRNTGAKAMLIEVCFCDNPEDVALYNAAGGPEGVAEAIFQVISKNAAEGSRTTPQEDHNMSPDAFMEYAGNIARRDWQKRRIMLPSVVVAQAIKESARGTSELAQKANALFGIKKNGWTGRTYIKSATEQRPDGSYYTVDATEWRAYDSWEESILDHNDYIATRSTDGGKTLRYGPVIGCADCKEACLQLQKCGYATSLTYAESLIRDYIEKYDLTRFDDADRAQEPEDEQESEDEQAPEGKLWVVQLGAYRNRRNAEAFRKELESKGIISLLKLYNLE